MLKKVVTLVAASAALTALTTTPAAAQSSVTIYGIIDAAVEVASSGNGTIYREVPGGMAASRLGFRGIEDLGGGLSGVFRLEEGFNTDVGTFGQGGLAWGREASVGLASRTLGTLVFGRTPMPYYQLSLAVDAFAFGQAGSLLGLTRSTATAQRQVIPIMATARSDNSFLYSSPVWSGLSFRVQGALGEGSTTIGKQYGGGVTYNTGPWNVILTGERMESAYNAQGRLDAFMAGGNYNFGFAKLYAGYTREKNTCVTCVGALARPLGVTPTGAGDFRIINVGTRVPFGPFQVIAQITRLQDKTQYAAATGNRDATWVSLGGEYAFSKRTSIYASAGTVGNKNGSSYALGTATNQQAAGTVGAGNPRAKVANVGVSHTF